jgi:adenylate cyclase
MLALSSIRIRQVPPIALLILLALSAIVGHLHDPRLSAIEMWVHDRVTAWRVARTAPLDLRVTVVDIDEASLGELGRWPWSRETLSRLFTMLLEHYGAILVGSDILLVDTVSGEAIPVAMADPRIVHPLIWSAEAGSRKGRFSSGEGEAVRVERIDAAVDLPVARSWLGSPDQRTALAAAHITAEVDADGIVRRMAPLVCSESGVCVESLALNLYRRLLKLSPIYRLEGRNLYLIGASHAGQPGKPLARLEASGNALLAWEDRPSEAIYASAAEVLRGRISPDRIAGRVVLVGSTALGLHDQIATPFASVYPSLEVHRNSLSALLDGRVEAKPEAARLFEAAAAAALVLGMWWLLSRGCAAVATVAGAAAVVAWMAAVVGARGEGIYLPFAQVLLVYFLYAAVLAAVLHPWEAQRRHAALITRFSPYVAPQVLERLQHDTEAEAAPAQRRCTITVLFADVRGYTRYSETVSPVELVRVTRVLMNALSGVVIRHGGTIDKYMGDNLMAVWGADAPSSDQAERAVAAAVEILSTIDLLNHEARLPGFRLGIGINTGDAIVGDMGSDYRYDHTVIGASVNMASHFESNTRESPYNLIIGSLTWQQSQSAQRFASQPIVVEAKGMRYEARGYAL